MLTIEERHVQALKNVEEARRLMSMVTCLSEDAFGKMMLEYQFDDLVDEIVSFGRCHFNVCVDA